MKPGLIAALAGALLAPLMGGCAPSDAARMAEEILPRLHAGHDPTYERAIKDREHLIAQGAAIFPGCIHILAHSRDDMVLSALLDVVVEMKTDVSPLLPSIRRLLRGSDPWIRILAVEVLGDVGAEEDVAGLLKLLSDRDAGVRKVAAQALAKRGTPEHIPKVREVREKRQAGMGWRKARRDPFIKDLGDVIKALGQREDPRTWNGDFGLRYELRHGLLRRHGSVTVEEAVAIAERRGIPMQRIVETLAQLVSEGLQAPRNGRLARILCKNSLSILGYLGRPSALPVIVQASQSKRENMRRCAISAYVRVRGKDSIEFAREVIGGRRFDDMDRFILYEQLSRYAAEEAGLDPDVFQGCIMSSRPPSTGTPKKDPLKEKEAAVTRLLAQAVQKERDAANAKDLDMILSGVSVLYRNSIQRERVLRRFARSWLRRHHRYFSAELKKLLQLPEEERTDLERASALELPSKERP